MTGLPVDVLAAETFSRDAAMFQGLLAFMTRASLVLWGIVALTLLLRFVAVNLVYRRRASDVVVEFSGNIVESAGNRAPEAGSTDAAPMADVHPPAPAPAPSPGPRPELRIPDIRIPGPRVEAARFAGREV